MTSLLPELLSSMHPDLNQGQREALKKLSGEGNVFVTGGAGTGKSYLMRKFLKGADPVKFPVLASTGAAAVLVGGRTFHSFFGLGILEGGPGATLERALKDRRVIRRLKKISGFVLDEVSMIPGVVFETAERIASAARGDPRPWGGLQVIAVGDFAQLPPITQGSRERDWSFKNPVWERSEFCTTHLTEVMRAQGDVEFQEILSDVRLGKVTDRVKHLLDWRSKLSEDEDQEASLLFARKADVDRVNKLKLSQLLGEVRVFETQYRGDERYKKNLVSSAPIPQFIELKVGALVMLRQNDPQARWVNGSLGHIEAMDEDVLDIKLMNGRVVEVEQVSFSMLDAEGNEVASAYNFPVNLAYAVTIHKAQGATLDRVVVSLKNLWEPGQAYVALSRVRSSADLMVDGWDGRSIFSDSEVMKFLSEA